MAQQVSDQKGPTLEAKVPKDVLVRLYPKEKIVISATTGEEVLVNETELFPGAFGCPLESWTNVGEGHATKETTASVYEMTGTDVSIKDMFELLARKGDVYCTQGQIIEFCRFHRDKLHLESKATFFAFKVKKFVRVINVYELKGVLNISLFLPSYMAYKRPWQHQDKHRVVVPF